MQNNDKPRTRDDQDRPNRQSNMEPAEGAGKQQERGTGTTSQPDSELPEEAVGQHDDPGGGISNRPLDEEQERQDQLPPRGERRENWKEG